MLQRFEYLRPDRLEDALGVIGQGGAEASVLAGGTDLLVQMKDGAVRPRTVVDIGRLDELRSIRLEDRTVRIGALATHREMAGSALIRRHAPALAEGAARVGSPQIRQRATIGGNLVNASPAADTVPPLFVLGSEVHLSSAGGDRWLAIEDFFKASGETVLRPDEMVTELRFPLSGEQQVISRYEKFGARNALSIAVTSVAAAAAREPDGRLAWIRIALGSVGPTVLRAADAEKLLAGERPAEELIARAARAAAAACRPIDDVRGSAWYRRQLTAVLLARILRSWTEGDRG